MFDIYTFFNMYISPKLSAKNQQIVKNKELFIQIYVELLNSLLGMIEYKSKSGKLPDGFNSTFLELYRLMNGHCGMVEVDGKYPLVFGSFTSNLDFYGIGTRYVATDLGGNISNDFEINTDIIIAKNNQIMTPDIFTIFRFVNLLLECDKSLDCLVIRSRASKGIGVSSETEKAQIESAMKSVNAGMPFTFVKSNLESVIDGAETVKTYDITDVALSDKIQYISKYRDDILRRFYTYYGNAMSSSVKIAQQTKDEVTDTDTMSMIYPLERLKSAREFCKAVNEKWGFDLVANFGQSWERNHIDIIEGDKETEKDNVSRETLEESEGLKDDND